MRVIPRTIVAGGAGAAVAAGLMWFTGEIQRSPEEMNRDMAACAENLGEIAMESMILPEGCDIYERTFPYTREIVTVYNPDERQVEEVRDNKTYSLPSEQEFIEEHTFDAKDQERISRVFRAYALFSGIVMGTWVWGYNTAKTRRRKQANELAAIEPIV